VGTWILKVCFHIQLVPLHRVRGKLQTVSSGAVLCQTLSGTLSCNVADDVHARAFLGIPFAEPPVGERRFARPAPTRRLPAAKRGVDYYDATTFAPVRRSCRVKETAPALYAYLVF
jgi:hypothetical protein